MTDTRTLAQVGEFEIVSLMSRILGSHSQSVSPAVVVDLGDDAAVVATSSEHVVAALDQMVEGRHFRSDWSSAHDVGRKAAARSLSDIAAMGARPTALLVGLAAPGTTPVEWVLHCAEGLAYEAGLVGARVVGGDTVDGPVIALSVTALGELDGPAVRREGAQAGDMVCVAGDLGRSAAGFTILSRGHRQPRSMVAAHRTPTPPYAAGPIAAAAGATAMIDVSDGLLGDAAHIARQSGVIIDFDKQLLTPDDELEMMARNLGVDVWQWVLVGGEDHALLVTFPSDAPIPATFRRVGRVLQGAADVRLDGESVLGKTGHEHFRD